MRASAPTVARMARLSAQATSGDKIEGADDDGRGGSEVELEGDGAPGNRDARAAFADDDADTGDSESTARSIALADSATALGAETLPQSSASLAKAAACLGRGRA